MSKFLSSFQSLVTDKAAIFGQGIICAPGITCWPGSYVGLYIIRLKSNFWQ